MAETGHPTLSRLLDRHADHPSLHSVRYGLRRGPAETISTTELIQFYDQAIPLLRDSLFASGPTAEGVEEYQALFRELESLYARQEQDQRHRFIVIIPVADRPRHLRNCLQSLLRLCQLFQYGGFKDGRFTKVLAIIADDSKEPDSIRQNRKLASHFCANGLTTDYFGLDEQRALLDELSPEERNNLRRVTGGFADQPLYHKGASLMRNICYLKLSGLQRHNEPLLFHFVDSDQEFQVLVEQNGEEKELFALNYFYELDRLFSSRSISVLTGKVVGDPPVSPAVMAATFLDDVIAFLQRMACVEANAACCLHQPRQTEGQDGAYHDMGELFGFKAASEPFIYRCSVNEAHDNRTGFKAFSARLNAFFHGEHPTRRNYFDLVLSPQEITPARTIYTGNYLLSQDALQYFIPFASLKLRMAGPVLGRIIKSEIGERFVSANLPMLHKRTVEDTASSEFRPGIEINREMIDLSGEFKRQFFGDVMLFSMETLTEGGFPGIPIPRPQVMQALTQTADRLRSQYAAKQQQIDSRLRQLKALFFNPANWWHADPRLVSARESFESFILNIETNFSKHASSYQLIDAQRDREARLEEMADAIIRYPLDRDAWQTALHHDES